MNTFSKAIYLARLEKGLSQKELAVKAGIPQPNLSNIEKGRDFKVSTLSDLAFALDVSVEDLIRGSRPVEIDKKKLFQRSNIEKAIACVINNEEAPQELKPSVQLISAIAGTKKGGRTSKKYANLSWCNLKKSFSSVEINAILSRLNKAKRRAA